MSTTVTVDPVSRIEGHLKIELTVDGGRVQEARSAGEMFRGFEQILAGRDPVDAQHVTQRICGVCPISHGVASSVAQEKAYGIEPPANGRLIRNLLLATNCIQSHVIHFYQLAALDFVDVSAILSYRGEDPRMQRLAAWAREEMNEGGPQPVAPLLPRMKGDYLGDVTANVQALQNYAAALDVRRITHEMIALFAGKMPHATGLVPGGVTGRVDAKSIVAYRSRLTDVRDFVQNRYLADVVALGNAFADYWSIGRPVDQLLVFGGLEQDDGPALFPGGVLVGDELGDVDATAIGEDNAHSFFEGASGVHPTRGETHPFPDKDGAYSWIKAPRYRGRPAEVGPVARVRVAAARDRSHPLAATAEQVLRTAGRGPEDLGSTMGRHLCRVIESLALIDAADRWASQLVPGEPTTTPFRVPAEASGVGLVEAPRGALGHWLRVSGGRIAGYQCVVPTTWNCSPRDDAGVEGPVESSLAGLAVADPDHPIEAMRVVRSFDPCLACAVH